MDAEKLPDNLQQSLARHDRETAIILRLRQRSLAKRESEAAEWKRIAQFAVITCFLLVITSFIIGLVRNNLNLLTILGNTIPDVASALFFAMVDRVHKQVNVMLEHQIKERQQLSKEKSTYITTLVALHNNEKNQKESAQDLAQTQAIQQTTQKLRVVPQQNCLVGFLFFTTLGIISMLLNRSTRTKIAKLDKPTPPILA